ncbi:FAD-binding oxidoreductase [Vibrio viridaestus]|nr:FAD-binding oxidoreductase [Vibrio viridaestus]
MSNTPACLTDLKTVLQAEQIKQSDAVDISFHKDWSSAPPVAPAAVVYPESTQQVAEIVKICVKHRQPMVAQGGRTGLAGAATPVPDAICISFEKMNAINDLDPMSNTISVETGITLQQVQEAALEVKRAFPVDFGARGSAQIGGVLATNAGGNNVIRYGMTRDNVLGLEVVTANGEIIDLSNRMIKNNTGYDLKQLFIGSEGTLGFITKATLKLTSVPGEPRTALCALESYENGVALLRQLQEKLGQSIHAFEMMWPDFYQMSCSWFCADNPPLSIGYPLYVLVECRDCEEEKFNEALGNAFEDELVVDAVIASSLREREKIWEIREATTEFPTKLAPINFDISLPIKQINTFVQTCKSRIDEKWPGALTINFGHIGDSNLHLTIDKRSADGIDELAADQLVYACVEEFNGSISAEHGIGTLKRDFLHHTVAQPALHLMSTIKQTLDPYNLLNPGKLIDINKQ